MEHYAHCWCPRRQAVRGLSRYVTLEPLIMRITRRQSLIITVLILAAFFTLSIWFFRGEQAARLDLTSQNSSWATSAPTPTPKAVDPAGSLSSLPPIVPSNQTPRVDPQVSALIEQATGEGSKFMLKDFHRSEMRAGKAVWEIKGSEGRYFPETNSATVSDAVLTLHRSHDHHVQLTAREVTIFLQGPGLKNAEAKGAVVITYDETTTLKTEFARFDNETGKITAPDKVRIEGESLDLTGIGLDGDLNAKEFRLAREVTTVLKPRKQQREL